MEKLLYSVCNCWWMRNRCRVHFLTGNTGLHPQPSHQREQTGWKTVRKEFLQKTILLKISVYVARTGPTADMFCGTSHAGSKNSNFESDASKIHLG